MHKIAPTPDNKKASTKMTIAPRGMSWHGDKLQKDNLGLLVRPLVKNSIDPSGKKSPTP